MISPTGSASFVELASVLLLFFCVCHGRITASHPGRAPRANGLWIDYMFLGDGRNYYHYSCLPPLFSLQPQKNSVTVVQDWLIFLLMSQKCLPQICIYRLISRLLSSFLHPSFSLSVLSFIKMVISEPQLLIKISWICRKFCLCFYKRFIVFTYKSIN